MKKGDQPRLFGLGIAVLVLIWACVVIALTITDVWDESRALNLFQQHDFAELVSSNWMQTEGEGVILFRPVPMTIFTCLAFVIDDPEMTWRLLRGLNAVAVLASCGLLIAVIRRRGGAAVARDLMFCGALLFSGSALITSSWFANGFDAMALFFIALGTYLVERRSGWIAGIAFGLAFFCKEVAVLALPFILVLGWTRAFERKESKKALLAAVGFLLLFLVLRSTVVDPGSDSDLRQISLAGFMTALVRLPVTFWWQVANVPVPWIGAAATIGSLAVMRKWQASVGLAVVYVAAAALYGPILKRGPSALIDADNFAGRLYLVPAALALTLVAIYGRRYALPVLLVPIFWGAGITAERHFRFQHAYLAVYELATDVETPPLRVLCRFTNTTFQNDFRGVAIGNFPDSRWLLRADGTLVERKRWSKIPISQSRARPNPSVP